MVCSSTALCNAPAIEDVVRLACAQKKPLTSSGEDRQLGGARVMPIMQTSASFGSHLQPWRPFTACSGVASFVSHFTCRNFGHTSGGRVELTSFCDDYGKCRGRVSFPPHLNGLVSGFWCGGLLSSGRSFVAKAAQTRKQGMPDTERNEGRALDEEAVLDGDENDEEDDDLYLLSESEELQDDEEEDAEVELTKVEGFLGNDEILKIQFPDRYIGEQALQNFQFLFDLGASQRKALQIFQENPSLLEQDMESEIFPFIEALRSGGVQDKQVVQLLAASSLIAHHHPKVVKQALIFLADLGVRRIGKVLTTNPALLNLLCGALTDEVLHSRPSSNSDIAQKVMARITNLRAIVGRQSIGDIIEKDPNILSVRDTTASETFEGLVGKFGREEAVKLVEKYPQMLHIRWKVIDRKLKFIEEVMERDLSEVLKTPPALTFSLEKRIKPRFEALKKEGLDKFYGLSWMLCCSDKEFPKRFGRRLLADAEAGIQYGSFTPSLALQEFEKRA